LGGGDRRITSSRPAWAKLGRSYLKNQTNKLKQRAGSIAQVVECRRPWIQSPVLAKKKKKKPKTKK
jgi:hypothetical protein